MRLHEEELKIDLQLVGGLVERAFPEMAGRSLRPLQSSGSTNACFRLGDDLVVRLPRQPGGSRSIEKEARWLGYVGAALGVEAPELVAVGEPDLGYPERWSVLRWIEGERPQLREGVDEPVELARALAGVVDTLGQLWVPPDAVADPALHSYRGEPLVAMDAEFCRYLAACRSLPGVDLDLDAVAAIWSEAMALARLRGTVPPRWLHGDLLVENVLVRDGRLAAVIDFGSLAVGDPAVDLVVAWELPAAARAAFRSALRTDEVTWLLGRAWALAIAMMTAPYYWLTMRSRCDSRLAMARAVLEDAISASTRRS